MKKLEIKTNKRLLIVEYDNEKYLRPSDVMQELNRWDLKYICKGPDFTEDIVKGFVEYDWIFKAYQYYQDTVPILGDTALNLFKVAIRNNGYYWDKPLKEWFYHKRYVGIERIEESFDYEKWQEAESRTFTPEKCIIFEIL